MLEGNGMLAVDNLVFLNIQQRNGRMVELQKKWSLMNAQISLHFSPGNILSRVSLSIKF